ncbi:MAG TPA: HAMP domain-containing sensor histidine kinase [Vicinamibacterales bacterium]|nr:HAMP domain-containing sensor histidine kinase [Vicinamibacterales bacterium]
MANGPVDPRWPKLLSLSVHEFRSPLTVVGGYLRMLLKESAGPLGTSQRRLLEEAERGCGRLSALLVEISDLANLEGDKATFNRQPTDLRSVLKETVAQLPPLPDREVRIEMTLADGPAALTGDPTRLRTALGAVLMALRRELVTSDCLLVREAANGGPAACDLRIGDPDTLEAIEAEREDLPVFDEWRGGCGLSLPVARRVIEAHGGRIWSAPGGRRAGARILLPVNG